MKKLEKFYESLMGNEIVAKNGDMGYIVTVSQLIQNGGRDEFFRTVRHSKSGEIMVSRNVYSGLEYDRAERKYFADCWNDSCYTSPMLKKEAEIFIGFDF